VTASCKNLRKDFLKEVLLWLLSKRLHYMASIDQYNYTQKMNFIKKNFQHIL